MVCRLPKEHLLNSHYFDNTKHILFVKFILFVAGGGGEGLNQHCNLFFKLILIILEYLFIYRIFFYGAL